MEIIGTIVVAFIIAVLALFLLGAYYVRYSDPTSLPKGKSPESRLNR